MYSWFEKRQKRAILALAGGEIFRGWSFGAKVDNVGEVVFNTGMTGYQEIMSDPSYAGQLVALTTPEVGNYGTNVSDMESRRLFANGLIVHNVNLPSNQRSEKPLPDLLAEWGVPAIAGIDTRRLTLILRSTGTQKGYLHCSDEDMSEADCIKAANDWMGLDNQDYVTAVSAEHPYVWSDKGEFNVVAYDYGIKYGILRCLEQSGIAVTVVPAHTPVKDVLAMRPDGVFFSNGPGDPSALKYAVETVKGFIGKIPMMGICLGHQLIGLSMGAKTERLKFGHHGLNHPVKNLLTGKVEITSQNHNYTVIKDSIPSFAELTHINLNDNTVEGMRHRKEPVFCVQYHPEASPGPDDSKYLFEDFKILMTR